LHVIEIFDILDVYFGEFGEKGGAIIGHVGVRAVPGRAV